MKYSLWQLCVWVTFHCADLNAVEDVKGTRHEAQYFSVLDVPDNFFLPMHLLFKVISKDLAVMPEQVLLNDGHSSVKNYDVVTVADLMQLVCS